MGVYVYEGYLQSGGTYMAYQIGRLIFENWGADVTIVGNRRPDVPFFEYSHDFPVIAPEELPNRACGKDLLICNPSFSHLFYGLRLNCKKLCYVQHVNTYALLDIFHDRYVFVSKFVKDFVAYRYRIDGPLINAYVNLDLFGPGIPWSERENTALVLAAKQEVAPLYEHIVARYRAKYPADRLEFTVLQRMPQKELANLFRRHKYLLNLYALEGFGLPALEAMACGCIVLGFDSYAGMEYFKPGENALVVPYYRCNDLVDLLHEASLGFSKSLQLSENATKTAAGFSRQRFDREWLSFLQSSGLLE
jgi:hypothetical protein